MVVDGGASDHYVDDRLVKYIKQLMFDYQELTLHGPSLQQDDIHYLELRQENYGARSPTATTGQEWRLYPSQLCLV